MKVTFWGVRGSIATGGSAFAGFGGNTTCLEVEHGPDRIIVDAGTGIRALGVKLVSEHASLPIPPMRPLEASLLFTHLHWDHVQGFPFFAPAFRPETELRLYGPVDEDGVSLEDVLLRQMQTPTFPVPLKAMAATMSFHSLNSGREFSVGSIDVTVRSLNHPQGCLGFRFEAGGRSLCFATDTEHREDGSIDDALLDLGRNVDLLIHDAQYTDDEYSRRVGWGHSSYAGAARIAKGCGARSLVLFHHDPAHDDAFLQRMENDARGLFPWCLAAREGLSVEV
ncbi:MAG: MBL fold metallo-hydrolase [Deltaproteobacteria bacterium]|nr:MBL fold metallo-hydrolase [Deltaproteobacteria bacterium]